MKAAKDKGATGAHKLRQRDAVLGPFRRGHAAHEGFGGKRHVGVDHIETPLVHQAIHPLAGRAAGMVQPEGGVAETHEVAEILQSGVAPPSIQVGHQRGAVTRHEDHVIPAKDDVMRRITPAHRKRRRRRAAELARKARIEAYPCAAHRSAGAAKQRQRGLISPELDADFLQDPVGLVFDLGARHLAEKLLGADDAPDRPAADRTASSVADGAARTGKLTKFLGHCVKNF